MSVGGFLIGSQPSDDQENNWQRVIETPWGEPIAISLDKPSFLKPRDQSHISVMVFAALLNEIDKLRLEVTELREKLSTNG